MPVGRDEPTANKWEVYQGCGVEIRYACVYRTSEMDWITNAQNYTGQAVVKPYSN